MQRIEFLRVALLSAIVAACASTSPKTPPQPFVDSEGFAAIADRTLGWLPISETRALAIVKTSFGVSPTGYVRVLDDTKWTWQVACEGQVIPGEDVETFVSLRIGKERRVAVITSQRDPDHVVQHAAIINGNTCQSDVQEAVVVPTEQDLLAPTGARGGVFVRAGTLVLVDDPKILNVRGTGHTVQVLTGVRHRRLVGVAPVRWNTKQRPYLRAVPVALEWVFDDGTHEAPDAIVGDIRLPTVHQMLISRGRAGSFMRATAHAPFLLLEWSYRCDSGHAPVGPNERVPVVAGKSAGKPIHGMATSEATAEGLRKELWVLREETSSFHVLSTAHPGACEIWAQGYAWRLDSDRPPSY